MLWVDLVANVNADAPVEEPALSRPRGSGQLVMVKARPSLYRRLCRYRAMFPSSSLSLGQWAAGHSAEDRGSVICVVEG